MGLDAFFEKNSTLLFAIIALVAFIGSSVYVDRQNPRREIEPRLKELKVPYLAIGTTFGYRSKDLYRMLDALTDDDKEAQRKYLYLDFLYALIYGLSLAVILAYLQRTINQTSEAGTHYLWLIPICAMVFDYAENISMLSILNSYKKEPLPLLVGFSRLMTALKFIFFLASLVIIILAVIDAGSKVIRAAIKGKSAEQQPVES